VIAVGMTTAPSDLDFDLSGIGLRLEGVPRPAAERLLAEWRVYESREPAPPLLRMEIRPDRVEPPQQSFEPKKMISEFHGSEARFVMPEGLARVDREGRGVIELARELGQREFYTLVNLVRASLAWCLPSRRSALLHAAGMVIDDRAFVLAGAESSGKSTWARVGEEAGAVVLSDDLVLLDAVADGYEILGAPFRSPHRTRFRTGRWPLAAILFPDHGELPRFTDVPPLLAKARVAANLTFIAEAVQFDGRISGLIDALATRVPCAQLTFAPDPSFVDTLRRWPGPA
jgi:hypothetical protein